MDGHKISSCLNAGWDDDPEWTLSCECDWEAWGHPTEESVREAHSEHVAEILHTGQCGCVTCTLERLAA